MLTTISNSIAKFTGGNTGQPQFDHKSKHAINLDTTQLKHELERASKLYDGAQEKYGNLNKQRNSNKRVYKRDVSALQPNEENLCSNLLEEL